MKREELAAAIREHAYLEGDFVLRSGRRSSYYLDKYRFETRPDLLAALGDHIAATVAEHEPDAVRLAGPELGAVALAAAASLSSGLPFLIVRKAAKEYGTANRLEGLYEPGERICLVEDVVTSGGAAVEALDATPRGRSGVPDRGLRGRSRGGRSGRSRASRSPSRAPVSGRRLARHAENRRKTAWLSRNALAVRVRMRITEPLQEGCT